MKSAKIIFWVTTGLIFLTQGLMPIFTTNMPEAKATMSHLGYPAYFALMLAVFKLLGGLALIIPQVPARIKEWAYAGFAIDFIAALVSFIAVDGFLPTTFFPLIAIVVLVLSYWSYHKMHGTKIFE
jgi:uncharacterized membrane protein YphA (DoxX/SURF4 family)